MSGLLDFNIIKYYFSKGLYYTGNVSAELAAEWVFENIDHPELNDPFQVCYSISFCFKYSLNRGYASSDDMPNKFFS
jgi:uncharacterized UBP type Zn finger protein